MAVAIDKREHAILMARLDTLIDRDPNPEQWQERKEELSAAYLHIFRLMEEIEQRAYYYRQLKTEIRPKVAGELRKMKKAEKEKSVLTR